jgi:hypothetical protein
MTSVSSGGAKVKTRHLFFGLDVVRLNSGRRLSLFVSLVVSWATRCFFYLLQCYFFLFKTAAILRKDLSVSGGVPKSLIQFRPSGHCPSLYHLEGCTLCLFCCAPWAFPRVYPASSSLVVFAGYWEFSRFLVVSDSRVVCFLQCIIACMSLVRAACLRVRLHVACPCVRTGVRMYMWCSSHVCTCVRAFVGPCCLYACAFTCRTYLRLHASCLHWRLQPTLE